MFFFIFRQTPNGIPHTRGKIIFNCGEELLRSASQNSRYRCQDSPCWLIGYFRYCTILGCSRSGVSSLIDCLFPVLYNIGLFKKRSVLIDWLSISGIVQYWAVQEAECPYWFIAYFRYCTILGCARSGVSLLIDCLFPVLYNIGLCKKRSVLIDWLANTGTIMCNCRFACVRRAIVLIDWLANTVMCNCRLCNACVARRASVLMLLLMYNFLLSKERSVPIDWLFNNVLNFRLCKERTRAGWLLIGAIMSLGGSVVKGLLPRWGITIIANHKFKSGYKRIIVKWSKCWSF
jgi:hypothetical protein